jgi:hypothetical protein
LQAGRHCTVNYLFLNWDSIMTRIEELVLQRKAIDAEIEAEYKKEREAAARGEAESQFNFTLNKNTLSHCQI